MSNFEKRIIDTILNTIKEHQEYLTKKENLPQLAKLGYMYNTLWYGGRVASYENVIPKEIITEEDGETWECNQCDDNAKYKIEMCDPKNEVIENYIYDAWGMHVSNDYGPDWDEFSTIVKHGRPLTDIEKKLLKPQKTFDEWVDIKLDPNYIYSSLYKSKRSVANTLLCAIGTGYGYKDGFIIEEASGADQDTTDYGDWMNAKFREDIQIVVDEIMNDPEVKKVMIFIGEKKKENREKEAKKYGKSNQELLDLISSKLTDEELEQVKKYLESDNFAGILLNVLRKKEKGEEIIIEEPEEPYHPFYPISNYSIITMLDKDSHPSYIKAAVEVCEDILAHREEEMKERKGNVIFAERFLKTYQNNFEEVIEEPLSLTDEELKVKIQQVKSSFSVEGLPLIKSDRFTQEEYDAMKEKTDAHSSHSLHLKVGAKVWTDEEIGEQITTMIQQTQIYDYQLQKFVDSIYETLTYEDIKKDEKTFKKALYTKLGWDKLKPLNPEFWKKFGSAPCSMSHNHRNIGDVEKGYGAVGMDDIFGDAFNMSYRRTYDVNNMIHTFKGKWEHKKQELKLKD